MKAKIVLKKSVADKIEYLTKNFDKEIGAFGLVKVQGKANPYFYIYDLLFPKQEVTGATIDIEPEFATEFVEKYGLKKLEKMRFYWHRHPYSSGHSSVDEVDTFQNLMNNEANRDFFVFLQTAYNNRGFNHEARIELRKPIRATIGNENIELEIEQPNFDKIKAECNEIIKNCVTEKKFKATSSLSEYGFNYWNETSTDKQQKLPPPSPTIVSNKVAKKYINLLGSDGLDLYIGTHQSLKEAIKDGVYGKVETDELNNFVSAVFIENTIQIKFGKTYTINIGKELSNLFDKTAKQELLNHKDIELFRDNGNSITGSEHYIISLNSNEAYATAKQILTKFFFKATSDCLKKKFCNNNEDTEQEAAEAIVEDDEDIFDWCETVTKEDLDLFMKNLPKHLELVENDQSEKEIMEEGKWLSVMDLNRLKHLGDIIISQQQNEVEIYGEKLIEEFEEAITKQVAHTTNKKVVKC